MKYVINLAPAQSSDLVISTDLLAQAQEPRPLVDVGGYLVPSGEPGGAWSWETRKVTGPAWTIVRDGAEVPAPYLAGEYQLTSEGPVTVRVYRSKGSQLSVTLQPRQSIAIPEDVLSIEFRFPAGEWEWPALDRVETSDEIQPAVAEVLRRYDGVRFTEIQRTHKYLEPRSGWKGPRSEAGFDHFTIQRAAEELGGESYVALRLAEVDNPDLLNDVLKGYAAQGFDTPPTFAVVNEAWNAIFPASQQLRDEAGGDFWESMTIYAARVERLVLAVREHYPEARVQLDSNQHITNLTAYLLARISVENTPDVLALNGYLYCSGSSVEESLRANLETWKAKTAPDVALAKSRGMKVFGYEGLFHSPNAGTWQNDPAESNALALFTTTEASREVAEELRATAEALGFDSWADYCFEREPRFDDPQGVFVFGIRSGLLSDDYDGRAKFTTAVPKQPGEDGPKPKAPDLVKYLAALESALGGVHTQLGLLRGAIAKAIEEVKKSAESLKSS